MTDHRVDRRQILKGATALRAIGTLAALDAPMRASADEKDSDHGDRAHSIEGSWLVAVSFTNGGPLQQVLHSYAAGGVVVQTQQGDPLALPVSSGPGLGTWVQTEERTFGVTILKLVTDKDGNYVGTGFIIESNTLAPDGNSYDGPWTFKLVAPDGTLLGIDSGTTHSTRIQVHPL